jgi:hypothetical protein
MIVDGRFARVADEVDGRLDDIDLRAHRYSKSRSTLDRMSEEWSSFSRLIQARLPAMSCHMTSMGRTKCRIVRLYSLH